MPHRICPNCGAYLDSFEHCDCKNRKKEESPTQNAGLPSKNNLSYDTIDDTTFKRICQELICKCERG